MAILNGKLPPEKVNTTVVGAPKVDVEEGSQTNGKIVIEVDTGEMREVLFYVYAYSWLNRTYEASKNVAISVKYNCIFD